MEAKNLAIVLGPTLIRKADDNMVAMVTDMSDHCKIIESIILHVSTEIHEVHASTEIHASTEVHASTEIRASTVVCASKYMQVLRYM